ncbi:fimbria/pilus outer membrane usher protein [Paracoccus aminovorans]|uniref:fimbria/pilus outer membrane usher protein n=1 Tax=Paracoccus aminovorans TaxID=34004 RepID=UPI002B263EE9|nr:fimbria/pilus outer membrane usher protein [Paracoccus aminovorans]
MPACRQGSRGLRHFSIPSLLALLFCGALAGPLAAQQEAGRQEGRDLYLEVFVNGRPMNLITRFTDLGDGTLSADAGELRNSGVLPDAAAARGEVRLDQIPGLGWRLIEPEQTIRFVVPDALLAPHVLNAAPDNVAAAEEGEAVPAVDHGYGLVLNYGVTLDGWQGADGATDRSLGASFDSRLFMPLGTLTHGFVLAEDDRDVLRYRRLDTYWRSSFPGRAVQVQLGDIATRGPGWSRPVRLGGLMVERNFGLRPDLVTLPLPGFEGSAALPSTVEVFADSIRTYAADIPAGPFRIDDLPLAGGSGMARVVVRDVTGRETQMDLPFLVSGELLRRGVADFALAAGRPRLGIGSDSDRYAEGTFGVATLRYGLTDALTLMAHAEGGEDLAMAGLGATFRVAHLGTASLSMARSRADWGEGHLLDFSTQIALGRAQVSGRLTRTGGRFTDIAALTADPELVEPDLAGFPRHLAQLAFSLPLADRGSAASLFLSDLRHADARTETSIGLSYNRQVLGDASLTLTALAQRGTQSDRMIGAQLHVPLGARHDAGVMVERRRAGWRQYATASGRSKNRVPGWSWRLQADRGEHLALQGSAAREGRLGRAELAARVSQGSRGLGLRLDGSVVAAGGGVFLSRRIDDAFAVVDVGAPGVEVSAENRPVGRTGRSGKILVPDLRAYEANSVSIDPAGLPLDAAVGVTRQSVRPAHHAGARVDFGVQASAREALVALVGPDGAALQVGGKVVLNGIDDELLVGFDGEVFALDLKDRNEILVSYPDGRACTARFDYADEPGTLTEIRGVPCL